MTRLIGTAARLNGDVTVPWGTRAIHGPKVPHGSAKSWSKSSPNIPWISMEASEFWASEFGVPARLVSTVNHMMIWWNSHSSPGFPALF